MSKYNVKYYSISRGNFIKIEDVAPGHLENAAKKLDERLQSYDYENLSQKRKDEAVLAAMKQEIAEREAARQAVAPAAPDEEGL